jgi:hypothetical protein
MDELVLDLAFAVRIQLEGHLEVEVAMVVNLVWSCMEIVERLEELASRENLLILKSLVLESRQAVVEQGLGSEHHGHDQHLMVRLA